MYRQPHIATPTHRPRPGPAHMADLEVLAHEEVERGAGVRADGADSAAAVSQEPQAEVGTQLCVFFEQQLRELPPRTETEADQFPDSGSEAACLFSFWGLGPELHPQPPFYLLF